MSKNKNAFPLNGLERIAGNTTALPSDLCHVGLIIWIPRLRHDIIAFSKRFNSFLVTLKCEDISLVHT